MTLERLGGLASDVLAVGAEDHRFMILDALAAAQTRGTVLLESEPRNTAAAIALAIHFLLGRGQGSDLVLFCPADHLIPDTEAFVRTIATGVPAAQAGAIVTFGVVPSFPSTAYGYICQGKPRSDGAFRVERFIEKPDSGNAQRMLLQGGVFWNAGIFLTRADAMRDALAQYAPDIDAACQCALREATEDSVPSRPEYCFIRPASAALVACRSQSIDYAVIEAHDDVAVVPFAGQWSDVGSWNAVADLFPADSGGNRIVGQGIGYFASNTFIHAPHRPVVALGTSDLLIIDTPDAILVAHKDRSEQVKDVVALLDARQWPQAATHRRVQRPWGWYDSLEVGGRFQVKRIGVKPGASLSLQKHQHRAEHWVVVKGVAVVRRGDQTLCLNENESTYIPIGEIHRLSNPGLTELEVIEVQSGDHLSEDDIVRLEDGYGRPTGE